MIIIYAKLMFARTETVKKATSHEAHEHQYGTVIF